MMKSQMRRIVGGSMLSAALFGLALGSAATASAGPKEYKDCIKTEANGGVPRESNKWYCCTVSGGDQVWDSKGITYYGCHWGPGSVTVLPSVAADFTLGQLIAPLITGSSIMAFSRRSAPHSIGRSSGGIRRERAWAHSLPSRAASSLRAVDLWF